MLIASLVPAFDVFKFDTENGCLQAVQAAVYPFYFMDIFFLRAMVGKQAGPAGKVRVVGDNGTAIAVGAQVFPG